MKDHYKINLPEFEGPLDLLLFLIRKNDVNIYDIPIAFITEEYLKYLESMKELNIDLAGEFLAMAAELIWIKSRLLLPQESAEPAEEETDPRAELARRLLEYQRFKMAAGRLNARPLLGRDLFLKSAAKNVPAEEEEVPLKGEVFQLMHAFSDVLKRLPKEMYHEVAAERLSLTERIYQIIDVLNQKSPLLLEELLPALLTRYDLVITFMALLEMTRLKMVRIHQEERFGPLAVVRAMEVLKPEEYHADIPIENRS